MAILGQAVTTIGRVRRSESNYRLSSKSDEGTSSASLRSGPSVNYERNNRFLSGGVLRTASLRGHVRRLSGGLDQNEDTRPFKFDYKSADEQGNKHYHQQEADASGTVRGSYGYTDVQGLYRVVDYIADANGFRAIIKTNEPGTGKESPADVQMSVDQPPVGIHDRQTALRGTNGEGPFTSRTRTEGYVRYIVPTFSQPADAFRYSPVLIHSPPPCTVSLSIAANNGYQRGIPVTQLAQPVIQPGRPVIRPARPIIQPALPVIQPARPVLPRIPGSYSPPTNYISPETGEEHDEYN